MAVRVDILKLYVGIAKDSTLNKVWMKPNKTYRQIAGTPCFLQVLNKKKSMEVDWTDPTIVEANEARYDYHYTDCLGSRIGEAHILFITDMMDKKQRDAAALEAAKRHIRSKIQQKLPGKTFRLLLMTKQRTTKESV